MLWRFSSRFSRRRTRENFREAGRLSTFRRDEKKLRKTPLFRLSFPSKNVEGRGGRAFIVTVRRWWKKAKSRSKRLKKKIGGAMEWMDGHRGIIDRVSVLARDHRETRILNDDGGGRGRKFWRRGKDTDWTRRRSLPLETRWKINLREIFHEILEKEGCDFEAGKGRRESRKRI